MAGLGHLFQNILHALFPRSCVVCREEGDILCASCAAQVKLPVWHMRADVHDMLLYTRASYKEVAVQRLLHAWKYRGDTSAGEWWKRWIAEGDIPWKLPEKTVIVPVPLAREAYAERGFNQAEELARALAQKYHLPVGFFLERVPRNAQAKTEKSARGDIREHNPYRPSKDLRSAIVRHDIPECVVIVDDVSTTGSTLRACADILRAEGVGHIVFCSLAYGNAA